MFGNSIKKQIREQFEEELKLKNEALSEANFEIQHLKEQLENIKSEHNLQLKRKDSLIADIEQKMADLEKFYQNKPVVLDKGRIIIEGFKLITPMLDKVLGRPFLLTVAEEFNYKQAEDSEVLNKINQQLRQTEKEFHCFRDEIKKDHSFRVRYTFTSREYFMETPKGKKNFHQLMFPDHLKSGLEITSQFRSAIYLCMKNRSMQSAVLPANIYGVPLLSYAFPVMDEKDNIIGAVSFSNDITQIVSIAKSLGNIVDSDSDKILSHLAQVLKEELANSQHLSTQIREESVQAQKMSEIIRSKGKEIIDTAERLKVLAINTAIEASKVGKNGMGVGIIAEQMRKISEQTRRNLEDIFRNSIQLNRSSEKVFSTSNLLESASQNLLKESGVLFNTSLKLTSQKDELATLVRMSLDEITQTQEDLNKVLLLLK